MRRSTFVAGVAGVAVGVGIAVPSLSIAGGSPSGPPPGFTRFLPVVYSSSTGAMRVVRPWGVEGASVPNCAPPSPWNDNPPYDATACNSGGSFDARQGEYYTELPLSAP